MRNIVILFTVFALTIVACKKKKILESPVVKIPSIALKGNPVFSTSVGGGGGTYVDPGATVTDESAGGQIDLSTPTENDIDFSTPGLYTAKYKYKTKYGYDLSISRLILVTNVDPVKDLGGTYARSSNGQEVHITKIGPGLYKTDNVGGVKDAPSFIYDVYFGFPDDTTLVLPPQTDPSGEDLDATDEAIVISATDTIIQWKVVNSNYGPALRRFVKL